MDYVQATVALWYQHRSQHARKQECPIQTDFLNKLNVALKEADETEYWLDILYATGYIGDAIYKSLSKDCGELIALLISITKTLKEKERA